MQNARVKPIVSISEVNAMLDSGQVEQALAAIVHTGQDTPLWRNARGVCLLRLGRLDEAMRLFTHLVFAPGSVVVPEDVPPLYVANFITAMLLKKNFEAAIPPLEHLRDDGSPYVTQLLLATRQWRRSLT